MTNNHSIDEMSESNNLADNHVEREEDDDWVELMDVDDDWGGYDEEEGGGDNDVFCWEYSFEEPEPLTTADWQDFKNKMLASIHADRLTKHDNDGHTHTPHVNEETNVHFDEDGYDEEDDLIDWNNKGDEDDSWVKLIDEDDDWGDYDEDDPLDRYDDFDDDGTGWDVYQGASANPYYNDQLDLDQQSDEFWECL